MTLGEATHAGCCVVPPLLVQEERLLQDVVGPALPRFPQETLVLRQWLDTAACAATFEPMAPQIIRKANSLARALVEELHPLAGRIGEMRRPIEISMGESRRRQPGGEPCHGRV